MSNRKPQHTLTMSLHNASSMEFTVLQSDRHTPLKALARTVVAVQPTKAFSAHVASTIATQSSRVARPSSRSRTHATFIRPAYPLAVNVDATRDMSATFAQPPAEPDPATQWFCNSKPNCSVRSHRCHKHFHPAEEQDGDHSPWRRSANRRDCRIDCCML